MAWGRSLLGRTSFLWAAGLFIASLLWVAALRVSSVGGGDAVRAHDSYFVIAHYRGALFGAVLLASFSAIYFLLEKAHRGRRRRLLGGLHFGTTAFGVLLSWGAFMGLVALGVSGRHDVLAEFRVWGRVASLGYLLMLLGQLFFVAVLIDALRRAPDPR